ncbi:MAG: aspartate/glutamate racemase family protein [Planctomycetes bacterium]|nr:aspartate/glutamate racemase family protein [Planctomycetota bacterium]
MSPESSRQEKHIIIGGGVGPMAGVALHAKIIEATRAPAGDASHLAVIHLSHSAAIPDRTGYLDALAKGKNDRINPGEAMANVLLRAARALPPGAEAVAGVPCNTFHAEPIYSAFQRGLMEEDLPLTVINMLEATASLLKERIGPGTGQRVGVFATNGTRTSRIYETLLAAHGYRIVQVPEPLQPLVHDAIYNPEWGIKAVSPVTAKAADTVREMAAQLARDGAEAIIPACTELPLALPGTEFENIPLVDPVLALARALVRDAAPNKLLSLQE